MNQKLKATFCQFTNEAKLVINRAHLLQQDVRILVDTLNGDALVTFYPVDGDSVQNIRLTDHQCLEKLRELKKGLRYYSEEIR